MGADDPQILADQALDVNSSNPPDHRTHDLFVLRYMLHQLEPRQFHLMCFSTTVMHMYSIDRHYVLNYNAFHITVQTG